MKLRHVIIVVKKSLNFIILHYIDIKFHDFNLHVSFVLEIIIFANDISD